MFGQVGGGSYLSRLAGGDESLFQDMEAPALRQFGELQGGLASRFSGMGGLGARRSSGFQNASSQAASSFAQDLQGQRQGLQRNALMDMFNMSQTLLGQRPQEKFLIEKEQKQPGFWKLLAGSLGENLGSVPQAAARYMMGGSLR